MKDNDRIANLKLLVGCAVLNHRIQNEMVSTPEFAACMLDRHDVVTARSQTKAFIHAFKENLALFSKSWVLHLPLSDHLRSCLFSVLAIHELIEIRRCLKAGWAKQYNIPRGGGKPENAEFWITPASRS